MREWLIILLNLRNLQKFNELWPSMEKEAVDVAKSEIAAFKKAYPDRHWRSLDEEQESWRVSI